MRLLWHSAAAWVHTGYGIQTRQFVKALQKRGHDVWVVPNGQNPDAPNLEWDGIPHLCMGDLMWGVDAVIYHTKKIKPDAVVTLMDIWPLPDDFGVEIRSVGGRWLPIAPVDHDPIPKAVSDRLSFAHTPIAMSVFGHRQMLGAGLRGSEYVPHAVDTKTFKPEPPLLPKSKEDFVVGMVATNLGTYDRKAWQHNLEGFALFQERHPEASLYIHANVRGRDAFDLTEMIKRMGIKRAKYPSKWTLYEGISAPTLSRLYNGLDVLLMCSRGEGFGIPLIEAQACGIPVVTSKFSSMEELVGPGWLVHPSGRSWTPLSSWQCIPDTDGIVGALENALEWRSETGLWSKVKEVCRAFAKRYDVDSVTDLYLVPTLEKAIASPVDQRVSDGIE